MADQTSTPDDESTAAAAAPDEPNEDLKAKYREALAHKHGSSGAHRTVHEDKGEAVHSQSEGPTQHMFRRRAGG